MADCASLFVYWGTQWELIRPVGFVCMGVCSCECEKEIKGDAVKSYKGQAIWAYFLVVLFEIANIARQDDWMWMHITGLVVVLINMVLIWCSDD